MTAQRDMRGIERRVDSKGEESFRGYVKQHGKKVRGSWGTYADARAWRVRAQVTVLDGGDLVERGGLRIRDAADMFLRGAEAGTILSRKDEPYASKTVRGYRQAFEDWINPELGHIAVTGLKRSQVQRFVDHLAIQPHKPRKNRKRPTGTLQAGTIRNTWAALAALYAYLLLRHDDITADPTDGVRLPRPGKPRERYAEPDEMAELLERLPHHLAAPYALAFYAGLRRAEIQALPWDMVDLEAGWLQVQYALDTVTGWKGPKSGAGERAVPIFAPLRPFLEHALEQLGDDLEPSTEGSPGTLLLPSRRASKWGAQMLGRPFTRACEDRWGDREPIGLHEARHSFVTALIRAGYDVRTVQEWAGHADPTTTLRIYAKKRGREAGVGGRMDDYLAAWA